MRFLTILAAFAVLSAAGEVDESASFAEKRTRNELLAARFAPSCAQLRVYFKCDAEGEKPTCIVRVYCPNCKDYHTRDVSSYMDEERPMESAAFAIAPNRFLAQDQHLLDEWVDRTEIAFGGKTYAAKAVARYPQEDAVEFETSEPVAGAHPLVFSKRIDFMTDPDGVFFFSTKDKGLAVCGTRANTCADFVRYGDIGKDVVSVIANTIVVNASNEAASVAFRAKIPAGEKTFVPPSEWRREPVGAFAERWEALRKAVAQSLVPIYLHLDDENNRKDGYSRRYRSFRDDSESTDIDLVGLVLPEGEILTPLNLDASKVSEIDKIEVILGEGKRLPLEFVGAFNDVKLAVFRFADGKVPEGFRAIALDTRRPETRFLEPAFVMKANNYNGKVKAKLAYAPVDSFQVGRGGECLPDVLGLGYREGGLPLLVYPDGTVGVLKAEFRQSDRYSDRGLVSAAKLGAYLADRDFDPQFAIRKGKDRVRIAWIGVETQRMTEELAREKKAMALLAASHTGGALVTRVWTNSPAAKAGLAAGDILMNARLAKSHSTRDLADSDSGDEFDWGAFFSLSIDGEDEEDYSGYFDGVSPWPNVERGVNRVFTAFGIGKKVVVAYVRNGERKEAEMTLEQAPVHYQTAKRVKNKDLGIIVSDMTFEVRGYFKFEKDAPGVVVVKVQPGNPAAIGGLRPLEIITHVNNEPVTGAKDFARKVKGKKDLTFAVRRLAATRIVRIELKKGVIFSSDIQ